MAEQPFCCTGNCRADFHRSVLQFQVVVMRCHRDLRHTCQAEEGSDMLNAKEAVVEIDPGAEHSICKSAWAIGPAEGWSRP